jgi:hypothetical protein
VSDRVADVIRVERHGDSLRITIDGQELPCDVDPSGVQQVIGVGAHPGLMLTIPARRVVTEDSLDERRSPEKQAALRAKIDRLSPPGS